MFHYSNSSKHCLSLWNVFQFHEFFFQVLISPPSPLTLKYDDASRNDHMRESESKQSDSEFCIVIGSDFVSGFYSLHGPGVWLWIWTCPVQMATLAQSTKRKTESYMGVSVFFLSFFRYKKKKCKLEKLPPQLIYFSLMMTAKKQLFSFKFELF